MENYFKQKFENRSNKEWWGTYKTDLLLITGAADGLIKYGMLHNENNKTQIIENLWTALRQSWRRDINNFMKII